MPVAQSRGLALRQRLKMLEEADDTKVLLTILRHGAPIINCLHLGHIRLQLSGWLKETMKES